MLRRFMPHRILAAMVLVLAASAPASADLRGHGGPVRALAVSPDGGRVVTGSFDTTIIVWDMARRVADSVLRLHEDSVNAVVILDDGRIVSGGQDGRVALWPAGGEGEPVELTRHAAPVVALALSPAGDSVASASWDGTARLIPLAIDEDGGEPKSLEGHEGNVNAVGFLPDGSLVTGGYDLTLRVWPADGGAPSVATLPSPLNALIVADDGEIVAAGADGLLRFLDGEGGVRGEVATSPAPVIALALSEDGSTVAAASIDGSVWIVDRSARQVVRTLQGADSPVWSLAFDPSDGTLMTGGGDRVVREWDVETGERLNEGGAETAEAEIMDGSRGAEIFRACSACHTLTEDGGNRAGPTLHGIFGRPIATAEGYNYSPALRGMDIVWTPETVSELFDVGPSHYTPGTKMPEQRIASAEDRKALIDFLQRTTR